MFHEYDWFIGVVIRDTFVYGICYYTDAISKDGNVLGNETYNSVFYVFNGLCLFHEKSFDYNWYEFVRREIK